MESVKIDFWDVWQGDASVVTLPDKSLFIIDTGDPFSPLSSWISQKPRIEIDSIVITHNDDDHSGGLIPLIKAYRGSRVPRVFLVSDGSASQAAKKLFKDVSKLADAGQILINFIVITGGKVPVQLYRSGCSTLEISAHYPFASSIVDNWSHQSARPNTVSAILTLSIKGVPKVVWAGDNRMSVVKDVCSGMQPLVMVGPHHGAPIDRPRPPKKEVERHRFPAKLARYNDVLKRYEACFTASEPENVYVSVGQGNSHHHPNSAGFIKPHIRANHTVSRSQLSHCGKHFQVRHEPVMPTHLVMGMLPPTKGVACRGPMQLIWNGTALEMDEFHQTHRDIILNGVVSPALCRTS